MSLLKKVLIICLLFIVSYTFYALCVLEIHHKYVDNPLINKDTINLLYNTTNCNITTSNSIVTNKRICTGMYTDGNYQNYSVIVEIPYNDYYLNKVWKNHNPSIAFESKLQNTKEWIINNKYKISMYYYLDDTKTQKVVFYHNTWVGGDHIVSSTELLPIDSKGKSVYVKYESVLGKLLFITNGNDVRFYNNYLSIR